MCFVHNGTRGTCDVRWAVAGPACVARGAARGSLLTNPTPPPPLFFSLFPGVVIPDYPYPEITGPPVKTTYYNFSTTANSLATKPPAGECPLDCSCLPELGCMMSRGQFTTFRWRQAVCRGMKLNASALVYPPSSDCLIRTPRRHQTDPYHCDDHRRRSYNDADNPRIRRAGPSERFGPTERSGRAGLRGQRCCGHCHANNDCGPGPVAVHARLCGHGCDTCRRCDVASAELSL
jgi:hypothetical protein